MDYLEPGKIRQLKGNVKHLLANSDEEAIRNSVLQEINLLIEVSEQNRRFLHPSQSTKQVKQEMASSTRSGN